MYPTLLQILTFNDLGKDIFRESGIDIRHANFFRDVLMEPSDSLIRQLESLTQDGCQIIAVKFKDNI